MWQVEIATQTNNLRQPIIQTAKLTVKCPDLRAIVNALLLSIRVLAGADFVEKEECLEPHESPPTVVFSESIASTSSISMAAWLTSPFESSTFRVSDQLNGEIGL